MAGSDSFDRRPFLVLLSVVALAAAQAERTELFVAASYARGTKPFRCPVLEPNSAVSMPKRWSKDTKRFDKGDGLPRSKDVAVVEATTGEQDGQVLGRMIVGIAQIAAK